MNNMYEQSYYDRDPAPYGDVDYWRLRALARREKRKAFMGGIFFSAITAFVIFLLFLSLSQNGITFMTCQEFGETFTCRLGGL